MSEKLTVGSTPQIKERSKLNNNNAVQDGKPSIDCIFTAAAGGSTPTASIAQVDVKAELSRKNEEARKKEEVKKQEELKKIDIEIKGQEAKRQKEATKHQEVRKHQEVKKHHDAGKEQGVKKHQFLGRQQELNIQLYSKKTKASPPKTSEIKTPAVNDNLKKDKVVEQAVKKEADSRANAEVKISKSKIDGSFKVSTGTFDTEAPAFRNLNIADGDANSEPLKTTPNGVKILSTDPKISSENVKIVEEPNYFKVSLPNGQTVQISRHDQQENAQIVFNGNTIALCNLNFPTFTGNRGGEKVVAINCNKGTYNANDANVKTSDDFVFVNCSDSKVRSHGEDNVAGYKNSNLYLEGAKNFTSAPTKVATDGSSTFGGELGSRDFNPQLYKTDANASVVADAINKNPAPFLFDKEPQKGVFSSAYEFSLGGIDSKGSSDSQITQSKKTSAKEGVTQGDNTLLGAAESNNSTKTQTQSKFASSKGVFNTNVAAFEKLNIAEGSAHGKSLVEVNGVKFLSTDSNLKPSDIKVTNEPAYFKVSLPSGQEIQISKNDQPENAQVVVNGETIALCNLNAPNFTGNRGDDKVVAINCDYGTFRANDANVKTSDDFVFVNCKNPKVHSNGEDKIVGLGNSNVYLNRSSGSNAKPGKFPTMVATDLSSSAGSDMGVKDEVFTDASGYQKGFSARQLLEQINKKK